MDKISSLPENDFLNMPEIELNDSNVVADAGPLDVDSMKVEVQCTSFLPTVPTQVKELDKLKQNLHCTTYGLGISDGGYNEFTTSCLATMAFPCLFPDGKGDPTNVAIHRNISTSETESFSLKLKHLIKFSEYINSRWYYRFASYPRFGYWAYNMLYRKRLLGQGNFYIKQNAAHDLPNLQELREMAQSGDGGSRLMGVLMHYAKNVTGTNAYWNQQKNNLKSIISQKGHLRYFGRCLVQNSIVQNSMHYSNKVTALILMRVL